MAERTYESITFVPASTHTIPAGDTVNVISGALSTIDRAIIASDTPGVPAMLNILDASMVVSSCIFTDIDASGGFEIDASDGTSIDGGGNTNITFPASSNTNKAIKLWWISNSTWRI